MATRYERKVDSYFEQCAFTKVQNALSYPKFHLWIGHYPPAGDHLRDLVDTTVRKPLTICGISDFRRSTREIQSVPCEAIMSQDHMMEFTKNYSRDLGARACWDVANENGEICTLVLVDSTAASEYAHAAESLARQPNFRPRVMYSDTWPNGHAFWELLFGNDMQGRLGLFHFNKRVISTLRPNHPDYRQAIADFRQCIYQYDDVDEANVVKALKDGTLGGEKLSEEDIRNLRYSPRWKSLCDPYLEKHIFSGKVIRSNLEAWFIKYKVDASDGKEPGQGRVNPLTGQKLFTPDTKGAVEECKKTCEFLQDVLTSDEMYCSKPASARSKHGLPLKISNRGESRLECFHGQSAHMANTGMRPSLSDALTIVGTAEGNVNIHAKIASDTTDPKEKSLMPAWLHGQAIFTNHSTMDALNAKAAAVGASEPFSNVRKLGPDTGEKFLSEYLVEQRERNANLVSHPANDRCQCTSCARNKTPLPHQLESGAIWNPYMKSYIVPASSVDATTAGASVANENDSVAPIASVTEGESALADESMASPFAVNEEDKSSLPFGLDDDESPLLPCRSTLENDKSPPLASNTLPSARNDENDDSTRQAAASQVKLAPKVSEPIPQGLPAPALAPYPTQPMHPQLFHHLLPGYPAFGPFVAPMAYPFPALPIASQHVNTRKRSKPQVEFCCLPMLRHVEQKKIGRRPHSNDCPQREKNRGTKRQRKGSK